MEFELRKYKKMEEDIGVDLFTLMCALSNPVYVVCPNIPPFTEGTVLCFDIGIDPKLQLRGEHPAFVIDFAGVGYSYYFKDYGKTWALTKEELL